MTPLGVHARLFCDQPSQYPTNCRPADESPTAGSAGAAVLVPPPALPQATSATPEARNKPFDRWPYRPNVRPRIFNERRATMRIYGAKAAKMSFKAIHPVNAGYDQNALIFGASETPRSVPNLIATGISAGSTRLILA